MSSFVVTTTTTTTMAPFGECCSLCLTQLPIPPTKQASLAPTFLRQLVDMLGFDVALPLCDGCHGDVFSVLEIIRQLDTLQKALSHGVEGIRDKKIVKTELVEPSINGAEGMSSGAITWLILPEVKMEQEETEEWNTSEIPSEGIIISLPPPTMGHFLEPAATTSQQDNNYQKQDGDYDQDLEVSEDGTDSSSDDDNESGVDEESSPPQAIKPSTSTPHPAKRKPSNVTRNFGLLDELITTLSLNPPLFQCNACLKKFKTKANIKYHQFCGNADSEKPFKCDQCGKGFISKSHYEYHLRTHTGERPSHVCIHCGKIYQHKDTLDAHMRTHSDVRPFACDQCTAAFHDKRDLKRHLLTHTEIDLHREGKSPMATATTTTTTEAFRGCCSLCLTQLSATPTKQAALAPTFLRQLIDLLGFDVALPLCDGCHGDVISVIDIIRQMNKLQKALGLGVVGITKKKKVITVLVTASLDGVAMSSEAETLIIAPQPAVKMKQEDIEEWNTSEIPSDWILSSNVTAQPPPTMGHFLEPFSPSATTSKQGNNCPKDDDQDPDVSGDETGSSSPDDDDDRGDDKIRPSDSPSLPPTTSTPGQAKEKRPGLAAKFPGWQKLITTLSLKPPLFQCNACSKKFKTKSNIKYHQFCGNADSEKPFKCDQCDKGFISKSHYEYHLRTHTGERPYPCSECDKSFNQKSKLTRHMGAVHDGKKEKRFVCDLCGAGFITKGKLQSHDVTHTDERPFKCDFCVGEFRRKDGLQRHIKNIHIKGKNKPNLKDRIQTNSSVPELKFDSADM
ncbi:hypothetical protein Fcan01_24871 [Folsomia candida]|uniref:C2H2-type domain-containing protein n=1 Tax=Folsomia candida TaxID=158441 RepID=A0A226D572_FOLCA|nr:hypothetical protein Fcan01_24871 [Folsomia candida]